MLVSELALTIASQNVVKVVKIVCICVVRVGGVPAIVLANIVPACVAVERWRGIRGEGRSRNKGREGGRLRERRRV